MIAETNASCQSGVLVENLQILPLFARVDSVEEHKLHIISNPVSIHSVAFEHSPHIRTGNRQIRSTPIEAQIPHHIVLIQLNCLKVLQLAQIPQLNARIVGGRRQIVAILRERNRRNRPIVAGKVGHVALLLQVPDLHLRILGAGAENQTVRMELRRRQADLIGVGHFAQQATGANVGERPVLVRRRGQHIVAGRMQRQTGDRSTVAVELHLGLRTAEKVIRMIGLLSDSVFLGRATHVGTCQMRIAWSGDAVMTVSSTGW